MNGKKYIVYSSDRYYPGVEEFDNEKDARAAWIKRLNQRDPDPEYVDTDYLAEVIEAFGIQGRE